MTGKRKILTLVLVTRSLTDIVVLWGGVGVEVCIPRDGQLTRPGVDLRKVIANFFLMYIWWFGSTTEMSKFK